MDKKEHQLVPEFKILNALETKQLLKKLNIGNAGKLPRIFSDDATLKTLKVEEEDIIEITRKSYLGIETKYWRSVIKKKDTVKSTDLN